MTDLIKDPTAAIEALQKRFDMAQSVAIEAQRKASAGAEERALAEVRHTAADVQRIHTEVTDQLIDINARLSEMTARLDELAIRQQSAIGTINALIQGFSSIAEGAAVSMGDALDAQPIPMNGAMVQHPNVAPALVDLIAEHARTAAMVELILAAKDARGQPLYNESFRALVIGEGERTYGKFLAEAQSNLGSMGLEQAFSDAELAEGDAEMTWDEAVPGDAPDADDIEGMDDGGRA